MTVSEMNLESLQIVYPEQEQFKTISRGLLLERLGLTVILLESLATADEFDESLSNIKNLLLYIHNN